MQLAAHVVETGADVSQGGGACFVDRESTFDECFGPRFDERRELVVDVVADGTRRPEGQTKEAANPRSEIESHRLLGPYTLRAASTVVSASKWSTRRSASARRCARPAGVSR